MDVGVVVPPPGPDDAAAWRHLRDSAAEAEALGLASVWVADRAELAGSIGLDPLVALAALSRATTRIRLGVLGLVFDGRPPGVVAKALSTIDVLSTGRLLVALAPADGVAEARAILQGAFGGEEFGFVGRVHAVAGLICRPRPIQRPGPPLWVADPRPATLDHRAAGTEGDLAVVSVASLGPRPAAGLAQWAAAGASYLVVGLQALPFEQTRTDLRLLASAIR